MSVEAIKLALGALVLYGRFIRRHFLRVLAVRWLNLEPLAGKYFMLDTASLSALSYEHDLFHPAIQFWNDARHAVTSD